MGTDPVCAQAARLGRRARPRSSARRRRAERVRLREGRSRSRRTRSTCRRRRSCSIRKAAGTRRASSACASGSRIDIVNSDDTLHNVHAMPMTNQEFNQGQPLQGLRMTKTFTAPEVMVRFKCDVHGWMTRVRRRDGASVLRGDRRRRRVRDSQGLPPGTYTIERSGTRRSATQTAEGDDRGRSRTRRCRSRTPRSRRGLAL